jgi:hypothetical protein
VREQVHRERARALGVYLGGLDASSQQALIAALPALEDLAERIDERRP